MSKYSYIVVEIEGIGMIMKALSANPDARNEPNKNGFPYYYALDMEKLKCTQPPVAVIFGCPIIPRLVNDSQFPPGPFLSPEQLQSWNHGKPQSERQNASHWT